MYFLYDIILFIYALIYLPYLLLTQRAYPGFGMRFGLFPGSIQSQIKNKANIWIHAVSVGEVLALDGFIDRLETDYPSYQIILTVTTKTGLALARQRLKDKALVVPSPIDFSFVTRYFVSFISPKCYIAVETEIWPNLYRQLSRKNIPMVVINGRISDASFGRYKAVSFLLKRCLNQVTNWCMQSQKDAQRIIDLGANPDRVRVCGNLKFEAVSRGGGNSLKDCFASLAMTEDNGRLPHYLWWVAGSTHPGEEEIVLDTYNQMIKDNPQWRLMIAPRHIERVPQIVDLVGRFGFRAVRFSSLELDSCLSRNDKKENGDDHDKIKEILIIDTIGQLRSLYALADLVFVGKSLCGFGGQNVIEPAFYGKAIVIGPRYENFRDIVDCFKEAGAIVQVEDVPAFKTTVFNLSQDVSKREQLGKAAQGVITANQGAVGRCLEIIKKIM
ncbi:MAG: 3-deoxy-D-manno-octulosonic acid transferase [Candidatus Omnitrophica bacterium]|nr:3-deoxy-D-manno-octulosonic acid transferase [Candidatus Omnitrophota bacterium]